jgi:hypothetical protein
MIYNNVTRFAGDSHGGRPVSGLRRMRDGGVRAGNRRGINLSELFTGFKVVTC